MCIRDRGIVVFNTPGANANAVKELVICALLLASRKVVQGANWVKGLAGTPDIGPAAEKGKATYAGPEIAGKRLGVIGLGAIGVKVANAAVGLDTVSYTHLDVYKRQCPARVPRSCACRR